MEYFSTIIQVGGKIIYFSNNWGNYGNGYKINDQKTLKWL